MRKKTNEFLRRIQSVRPEVKKNLRRGGGANAAGKFKEEKFFCLNKIFYLADASAGVE
jgi:hypothetical protein